MRLLSSGGSPIALGICLMFLSTWIRIRWRQNGAPWPILGSAQKVEDMRRNLVCSSILTIIHVQSFVRLLGLCHDGRSQTQKKSEFIALMVQTIH